MCTVPLWPRVLPCSHQRTLSPHALPCPSLINPNVRRPQQLRSTSPNNPRLALRPPTQGWLLTHNRMHLRQYAAVLPPHSYRPHMFPSPGYPQAPATTTSAASRATGWLYGRAAPPAATPSAVRHCCRRCRRWWSCPSGAAGRPACGGATPSRRWVDNWGNTRPWAMGLVWGTVRTLG